MYRILVILLALPVQHWSLLLRHSPRHEKDIHFEKLSAFKKNHQTHQGKEEFNTHVLPKKYKTAEGMGGFFCILHWGSIQKLWSHVKLEPETCCLMQEFCYLRLLVANMFLCQWFIAGSFLDDLDFIFFFCFQMYILCESSCEVIEINSPFPSLFMGNLFLGFISVLIGQLGHMINFKLNLC